VLETYTIDINDFGTTSRTIFTMLYCKVEANYVDEDIFIENSVTYNIHNALL